MAGWYDRSGANNPKWRGGISLIRTADDILSLNSSSIEEIRMRFNRLWKHDDESKCWLWVGRLFKSNGRAKLILGTNLLASRVSYVLHIGLIRDKLVCHECDNVICVNPEHLWLGTNKENSTDMIRKGRNHDQTGSFNNAAKLDETIVRQIKIDLWSGIKQNEIALKYKVCKQTITLIKQGKVWRHVK